MPTGRESYGNGVPIVVMGVTPHQGERESRLQGKVEQVIRCNRSREVRRMRTAETILNIIRTRGQRGLPVEDVYRLLYNLDLYLRAYGKLNSNAGAMTPGATPETVDGMSLEKANKCEICGATDNIEVHHIRKLADIKQKGRKERPEWMLKMSARKRKTLVVCCQCHEKIQYGRYDGDTLKT
ncbi:MULTISPECIES: hypothetical protein [Fischerella]|nr:MULTISPECIES: hypothetical protein [Fischerella]MBD2433545.1 hypothetical protein [Fischerella sp. FACHB-380]